MRDVEQVKSDFDHHAKPVKLAAVFGFLKWDESELRMRISRAMV